MSRIILLRVLLLDFVRDFVVVRSIHPVLLAVRMVLKPLAQLLF